MNLKVTKIGENTERMMSSRYDVTLINEQGEEIMVSLLGLERIFSAIQTLNTSLVSDQFPEFDFTMIHRPMNGDVDVLLGLDVAGLHPVRN